MCTDGSLPDKNIDDVHVHGETLVDGVVSGGSLGNRQHALSVIQDEPVARFKTKRKCCVSDKVWYND